MKRLPPESERKLKDYFRGEIPEIGTPLLLYSLTYYNPNSISMPVIGKLHEFVFYQDEGLTLRLAEAKSIFRGERLIPYNHSNCFSFSKIGRYCMGREAIVKELTTTFPNLNLSEIPFLKTNTSLQSKTDATLNGT